MFCQLFVLYVSRCVRVFFISGEYMTMMGGEHLVFPPLNLEK